MRVYWLKTTSNVLSGKGNASTSPSCHSTSTPAIAAFSRVADEAGGRRGRHDLERHEMRPTLLLRFLELRQCVHHDSVPAASEGVSYLTHVRLIAIVAACLVIRSLAVPAITNASPDPAASPYERELQFCVDRTNQYRASVGLRAMSRSADLERYADAAARHDGKAHKPHSYFKKTHGGGIALAENAIPWWPLSDLGSVQAVVDRGLAMMWAEGKGGGHYRNLTGRYAAVGCGVFVNGDEVTVVQAMR